MKLNSRDRRHVHIRKRVNGTTARPRLAIFRSSQHIYAQLIDDTKGVTLIAASDLKATKGSKKERALEVGKLVAEQAVKKGIKEIVFDHGGFLYHGRVAQVAQGAREGGLVF
jgi:large subunit ribosomal protein L18